MTWGIVTCDMGGGLKCSDMEHCYFLSVTCDIEENKRQRHATLPFLEIDMRHWGPPSRAPVEAHLAGTPYYIHGKNILN